MTVALWYIVSTYMINQILNHEWATMAQFVRTEVKQFLTPEDFKAEDRKSVGHKFDELLRQMTLMPEIVRFKVYNPQGVVIWSDDKRVVGQSSLDNEELQEALTGKVVVDMSSLTKQENIFEHDAAEKAVELYVPIYGDNPRELLGVFETYKRADAIYRSVREARMLVLLGALGGGLLLYLSLIAIVRQAAHKIAEQQENLLRVQSELVASQRMAAVGEMAAAVAHGIGNPLSSIRAAAQVAKLECAEHRECPERETTQSAFQNIIEQVDRVQKRMQGLLNFARPLEPRPQPMAINALIGDVAETLRSRFETAEVKLRLELASDLPETSLDPNHVEQVLMGLMTNALEATPPGGMVTIRTKFEHNGNGRAVSVFIEDTGEGIPGEMRERVFEPFFTTKSHGTGIGLALAKKLVERNGGSIGIAESSGGGTRIDVTLPVSRAR